MSLSTPSPDLFVPYHLVQEEKHAPRLIPSPGLLLCAPTHYEEHGSQEGDEGDVVDGLSRRVGNAPQGPVSSGAVLRRWHKVDVEPHGQVGGQHDSSCGEMQQRRRMKGRAICATVLDVMLWS